MLIETALHGTPLTFGPTAVIVQHPSSDLRPLARLPKSFALLLPPIIILRSTRRVIPKFPTEIPMAVRHLFVTVVVVASVIAIPRGATLDVEPLGLIHIAMVLVLPMAALPIPIRMARLLVL